MTPGSSRSYRGPPRAGPVQVPCPFPSRPPRPVNALLPGYTHSSPLSPHSSDPSSVPTRLTLGSVLSDVPPPPHPGIPLPTVPPRASGKTAPLMVSCFQYSSLSWDSHSARLASHGPFIDGFLSPAPTFASFPFPSFS